MMTLNEDEMYIILSHTADKRAYTESRAVCTWFKRALDSRRLSETRKALIKFPSGKFSRACANGQFLAAQWIVKVMDLARACVHAMSSACDNDQKEIARWLAAEYDLRALQGSNKTRLGNIATSVCYDGNLELTQWLVKTLKLEKSDFSASSLREIADIENEAGNWLSIRMGAH
jgi:hypothetical protein